MGNSRKMTGHPVSSNTPARGAQNTKHTPRVHAGDQDCAWSLEPTGGSVERDICVGGMGGTPNSKSKLGREQVQGEPLLQCDGN